MDMARDGSKPQRARAGDDVGGMFARIGAQVRKIPRGRVATYGAVARAAGYPGAARQVVWALRALSGVPWHRVLGAGGRILLPGEGGMEQRLRLEMEGVTFRQGRVAMPECEFQFRRSSRSAKSRPLD
jgi:methylated-DNA-protein-cysteine methyltransferase-like protein